MPTMFWKILRIGAVSAGVLGVLALAAYWSFLSSSYQVVLDRTPESQPHYSNEINIDGTVTMNSSIGLFVNGLPLNIGRDDFKGFPYGFKIKNIHLPYYRNRIEIRATTVRAWREFQTSDWMYITVQPDPPTAPVLSTEKCYVNSLPMLIRGAADPRARVEVTVNGSADLREPLVANEYGEFFYNLTGEPGEYKVSAKAQNALNHNSDRSDELMITYDPKGIQSCRGLVTRKVKAHISFKKLVVDLQTTLPNSDPRATDLISGQLSFPEFIKEVFGELKISHPPDEYQLERLFFGVVPQIHSERNSTTIQASSNPKNQITLPSTEGTVAFSFPTNFSENLGDRFALEIQDYDQDSLDPPPSHLKDPYWDDPDATWTGSRREVGNASEVVARLRHRPQETPGKFLHFIQANPFDVIPFPFSIILEAAYGLLLIIPIVWLLWILHRSEWSRRFNYPTLLLGAGCFVATLTDLVLAKNNLVAALADKLRIAPELLFVTYVALFSGVLAGFVFLVLKPSRSKRWAFIAGKLMSSVLLASIPTLVMVALLWTLIRTLPHGFTRDRLWAALVGSGFAVLLLGVPFGVYLKRAIYDGLPLFKKIGLIALIAIPLSIVPYSLSGNLNDTFWFNTYAFNSLDVLKFSILKISYLFWYIQDFVPYILFLGLLPLMADVRESSADTRCLKLGRFLFASYVVGITAHFYLIPIPFLLAFLVYPRIMVQRKCDVPRDRGKETIDREQKAAPPNGGSQSVESFSKAIDSFIEVDLFRASMDGLKKKLSHGEVSPARFIKNRTKLQEMISQSDRQSRPDGVDIRQRIFGSGPHSDNWQNGKHSAKYGLFLALTLLPIYIGIAIARDTAVPRFALLSPTVSSIVSVLDWVILAFFFGYYFEHIRGASGLRKGVFLALAYTTCLLPVWIINLSSSAWALVLFIVPNFIFLPLLGIWAFDLPNFRQHTAEAHGWKKLAQLENMPTFLVFSSIPFASIAVAVTSFLTGAYKDILPLLLKLASAGEPTLNH